MSAGFICKLNSFTVTAEDLLTVIEGLEIKPNDQAFFEQAALLALAKFRDRTPLFKIAVNLRLIALANVLRTSTEPAFFRRRDGRVPIDRALLAAVAAAPMVVGADNAPGFDVADLLRLARDLGSAPSP